MSGLSDYGWKALYAMITTIVVLVLGIIVFWAIRGFLPGSRIVEVPLSTTIGVDSPNYSPTDADFNFYYVDWCPYCQDALPAVRSLSTLVSDQLYGLTTVHVNCESQPSTCRTAGVDGYPSYSLVTPQGKHHYAGPPKTATYEQFLVSALGPKKKSPSTSA
jgi:hypothetical protein